MQRHMVRMVAGILAIGFLVTPLVGVASPLAGASTDLHPLTRTSFALDLAQLTQEERALPPPATAAVGVPPEMEARILLELARRLRDQGEIAAARVVLRDIVDRFEQSLAAAEALDELNRLPAPPPATAPPPGSTPRTPPAARTPGSGEAGALDQSGRIPVIVYSTLLASYLGLAIPIASDAEGSTPYGLGIMLGAPTGLVSSIYLTRNRKITSTQADLFTLAGNWGLFHGLALGIISDGESNEVAGSAALGGLLGVSAGAMLIAPGRNRESTVALTSLATTTGAWLGLVGSQLTSGEYGPDDNAAFTGMLLGGDAALMAAVLTGPHVQLSRSRARLLGLGATVGALTGLAFDLTFSVDGRKESWSLLGVGTLAGLIGAVALTSDFDTKRGFSEPGHATWLSPDLRPLRGGVGLALLNARF